MMGRHVKESKIRRVELPDGDWCERWASNREKCSGISEDQIYVFTAEDAKELEEAEKILEEKCKKGHAPAWLTHPSEGYEPFHDKGKLIWRMVDKKFAEGNK
jgi:hypothetical protein